MSALSCLGGMCLLTAMQDGTYTVHGQQRGLLKLNFQLHSNFLGLLSVLLYSIFFGVDDFTIVHQSPSEVKLSIKLAIPLYCICSGHCLEYNYAWMDSGQQVGCNSTVLWVKTPGLYRCHVTHHITHMECLSSLISVTECTKGWTIIII